MMEHKAKKSLGQNFLKSQKVISKICETGNLVPGETVLEIGPGKGALTEKLLKNGAKVIAIEKDEFLVKFLQEKFEKEIQKGQLVLLNKDILEFEIPKNFKKYKLIANIPYNITGAIFKKFLEEEKQPEKMVLLVQKEVAERIVARDGKESILSISIKAYGTPKYIMTVNKRLFAPSPKIDSAVISISDISKKNFKDKNSEKAFFEALKAGFAHKRKLVISNLTKILKSKSNLGEIFNKIGLDKNIRAENLTIENWIDIASKLNCSFFIK
jgi:16S rRNA (adenine1518-N6/adenine1519-N6)-dimethyltransferase